ncbi:hypothetical protein U1Q18_030348, partial [Sarracenia purpurea var. burkii]
EHINLDGIQEAMKADEMCGIDVKALRDNKVLILLSNKKEKKAYMESAREWLGYLFEVVYN